MHVVLAGGGSAGHVEPALALADALRRLDPTVGITALGTATGLEARLVPARGYELAEIPRVPLPRQFGTELLSVPSRLRTAVRTTRGHLDRVDADAVVGFGGYVSVPAYLAARRRKTPVVVHEANARAGIANRLGSRWAAVVATAVPGTGLRGAQVIGVPLRRTITELDRPAARGPARAALGLTDGPVLLVTGGSQGARRLNTAVVEAVPVLAARGVQVLHVTGSGQADAVRTALGPDAPRTHHVVDYVNRMDQAYAAADLALCRAGMMTVSELTAVGLPGVFVPLPIGNGEQALNAQPVVRAGGGLLVDDQAVTSDWLIDEVLPLLLDAPRLTAMGTAAAGLGCRDADVTLARMVLAVAA